MPRHRRTWRLARRSTVRPTTRTATRVRWRAPDDLGQALGSYRRAITTHRRLTRLAPAFFDSVLVERQRLEQEAHRRWMDSWEPALAEAYGAQGKALSPKGPLPASQPSTLNPQLSSPLPSPRTQAKVELQLAFLNFYLAAGDEALRHFHLRHPHALVSFSRLASLYEIGFALAHLATGLDSTQPAPEPPNYDAALADLKRIYGH